MFIFPCSSAEILNERAGNSPSSIFTSLFILFHYFAWKRNCIPTVFPHKFQKIKKEGKKERHASKTFSKWSFFFKFRSLHRDSNTFLSRSEGHQPISLGSGDKVWKTKRSSQPAEEPCSPGVGLSALRSVSLLIPPPCSCTSLSG